MAAGGGGSLISTFLATESRLCRSSISPQFSPKSGKLEPSTDGKNQISARSILGRNPFHGSEGRFGRGNGVARSLLYTFAVAESRMCRSSISPDFREKSAILRNPPHTVAIRFRRAPMGRESLPWLGGLAAPCVELLCSPIGFPLAFRRGRMDCYIREESRLSRRNRGFGAV